MIYLDYNATTPVAPEVFRAMRPYLEGEFGNPSCDYALGLAARDAVRQARQEVAALLGCAPQEIVFTSGATEANNTVLKGVAAHHGRGQIITCCHGAPGGAGPLPLFAVPGVWPHHLAGGRHRPGGPRMRCAGP